MKKKTYIQPVIEADKADIIHDILAGSVDTVVSDGLDDGESLELPSGIDIPGSIWDIAL